MLDGLVRAIDAAVSGVSVADRPPPWIGWLVVALVRQRARQAWHRQVVNTHLRGVDSDDGSVPNLPGWTYNFHGIGCCLTGSDGEVVDVDFNDEDAAIIDPWFFAWRIRSVSARHYPEIRLWHWMPDDGLVVAALDELLDVGAIESQNGTHLFRLAAPLEERVAAVEACDFGNHTVGARWAEALADDESPTTMVMYHRWLTARAMDPRHSHDALGGVAARLPQEELRAVTLLLLQGPIGPTTGRAIEIMRGRPGPECDEAVRGLLERISPVEDPPYPAYTALAYLLERNVDPEYVTERFGALASIERAKGFNGNPFLGQYAMLALGHRPSMAMSLIRRALRSSTPVCVSDTSALLCAMDQPWCHRELAAALPETARGGSAYIAEALRRSESALARRRAEKLYSPPTHEPGSVGFTYEEVLDNSVGSLFDEPLARARPLANELRGRFPSTWEG